MRLQLPKHSYWLLLAPALALLLLFGPLRGPNSGDSGGGAESGAGASAAGGSRLPASERLPARALRNRSEPENADAAATGSEAPTAKDAAATDAAGRRLTKPTGAGIPEMPSMWQVVASLIGVLLLGVVGLAVLRRVRAAQVGAGRPEGGAPPLALLQSLRLTPKHTVHVVRFDEQVLLLGEADAGLNVLQALPGWQGELDEREIAGRGLGGVAASGVAGPAGGVIAEDGAVPRDMVLPRPAASAGRQAKAPRSRSASAANHAAASAEPAPGSDAPVVLEPQVAPVNDFRALLQRAKTAIQA